MWEYTAWTPIPDSRNYTKAVVSRLSPGPIPPAGSCPRGAPNADSPNQCPFDIRWLNTHRGPASQARHTPICTSLDVFLRGCSFSQWQPSRWATT